MLNISLRYTSLLKRLLRFYWYDFKVAVGDHQLGTLIDVQYSFSLSFGSDFFSCFLFRFESENVILMENRQLKPAIIQTKREKDRVP